MRKLRVPFSAENEIPAKHKLKIIYSIGIVGALDYGIDIKNIIKTKKSPIIFSKTDLRGA